MIEKGGPRHGGSAGSSRQSKTSPPKQAAQTPFDRQGQGDWRPIGTFVHTWSKPDPFSPAAPGFVRLRLLQERMPARRLSALKGGVDVPCVPCLRVWAVKSAKAIEEGARIIRVAQA
jgi:hypothetical protein